MSDLISRSALIEHIKDVPTWIAYDKNPRKYPVGMYDPEDIISSIENAPTIEAEPVVHGEWIDGRCSNCNEEALSTSWDEPVYDYDWEESLRYSHTETHTEYHLTDYCPNCGAKMIGGIDYDSGKSN